MVCFRYINVKALHNSDKKDDNNNTYQLNSLFTEDKLHLHCKYLPVNVCGNNICQSETHKNSYTGSGGKDPLILQLGTKLHWAFTTRPGSLIAGKEPPPLSHWIGCWVVSTAGSGILENRKTPLVPARIRNPQRPATSVPTRTPRLLNCKKHLNKLC
jgi:hypothetical protein